MISCQLCKNDISSKSELDRANEAEINSITYYVCKECRDRIIIQKLKDSLNVEHLENEMRRVFGEKYERNDR